MPTSAVSAGAFTLGGCAHCLVPEYSRRNPNFAGTGFARYVQGISGPVATHFAKWTVKEYRI